MESMADSEPTGSRFCPSDGRYFVPYHGQELQGSAIIVKRLGNGNAEIRWTGPEPVPDIELMTADGEEPVSKLPKGW